VRAVATSAVRESANRDELLDRIFIATGIHVEVMDEAEVNRLTYLAVLPVLKSKASLSKQATLIVEVGGGSTELLLLEEGLMTYSETYRLGSQRMREMLDSFRTPAKRMRGVMETHIQRAMDQIVHSVPRTSERLTIVVMGGDARFAASELDPEWEGSPLTTLRLKDVERLVDDVNALTPDEIVREYGMSFSDATLVGPTLLVLGHLVRTFGLDRMFVCRHTLRDGMLLELATGGAWTDEFTSQIIGAALTIGRKYRFDEAHSCHVAFLCLALFDQLQDLHGLAPRYRLLLEVAALLHEVGLIVSTRSHHKHSMYLILHSEIFGLSSRDIRLVALAARYHRRAHPRPNHEVYDGLDRDERILVSKLSALLRVADALDRVHHQHVHQIDCLVKTNQLDIVVPAVGDLTLEQVAIKQKGRLFEQVFGRRVVLRAKKSEDDHGAAV
jgi:exopolyphosphatase/guanosine-5'-triphosphate,3'-diphosphate pyrophosphatase